LQHTGHPGKKKKKQLVTVFWTHFIVFFLTTLFLVKIENETFPKKNVFVICYRPSKAIKGRSRVGQKTDERWAGRDNKEDKVFLQVDFFL
jgi:hypothetical protein